MAHADTFSTVEGRKVDIVLSPDELRALLDIGQAKYVQGTNLQGRGIEEVKITLGR